MRRLAIFTLIVVAVGAGAYATGYVSHSHPSTTTTTVAKNSTTEAASTPSATEVEVLVPWTFAGALSASVEVGSHVTGSCWTGSIAVDSPAAWRCMSVNEIYDPCFSASTGTGEGEVACFASPWAKAVVMKLSSPLSAVQGNTGTPLKAAPARWAIELANGMRCVESTGANASLGDVPLVYGCEGGDETGPIDDSTEPWTVELYRSGSDVLTPVRVEVAWTG